MTGGPEHVVPRNNWNPSLPTSAVAGVARWGRERCGPLVIVVGGEGVEQLLELGQCGGLG